MHFPSGTNSNSLTSECCPAPFSDHYARLARKINGGKDSTQVVSDASLAAAMLNALPDADWSVEKAVMKNKATISPSVIIAKV